MRLNDANYRANAAELKSRCGAFVAALALDSSTEVFDWATLTVRAQALQKP